MKTFYRNRLPHIAPAGAAFFITFRLGDSLPVHVILELEDMLKERKKNLPKEPREVYRQARYNEYKRYFRDYDRHLDLKPYGNCYLRRPEIAQIVMKRLHKLDGELYSLIAYCIMPNHVHILIDTLQQLILSDFSIPDEIPEDYVPLYKIMQLIKGATSRYANLTLGRKGKFWQKDSYDHYVRDERELGNIAAYILNNPVKANLVQNWEDWPFSYHYLYRRLPANLVTDFRIRDL